MRKPCPFCCNPIEPYDDMGACCFCDYQGYVTIGKYGMFSTIEQYNKIFYTSNYKDRLDELHGRNEVVNVETLTLVRN